MSDNPYTTYMRQGCSWTADEEVHERHYDFPLTEVRRARRQCRVQRWLEDGVTFDRIDART